MKKDEKKVSKWLFWFSLVLSLIVIYKVLDSFTAINLWISNLLSVIGPFIIGIIIAYVLYLPCRNLEKIFDKIKYFKKISRGLSVLIVYIIALFICIIAFRFIIPALLSSLQDLIGNLQNYYNDIKTAIRSLPEDSVFKSENILNIINSLSSINVEEYINLDKITQYAQSVISFASGVFDVFISIIVSVYILLERREIVTFFKKLTKAVFSDNKYKNIKKYFSKSNEIFCRFLTSQFLDAIVVAILASVAMSLMKVKYAVLLGIFIGIFNLIPYFGAIIAVVISILITILTGGLSKAIEMAIAVIILQQLDANVINPKIVGESLKISPLLVIFSVTIGGAYFGVLGMFLAVPFAAVLKLIVSDYIEYKCEKKDKNIELTNTME